MAAAAVRLIESSFLIASRVCILFNRNGRGCVNVIHSADGQMCGDGSSREYTNCKLLAAAAVEKVPS